MLVRMNTNERNGKIDQVAGKVKQVVGVLTSDNDLKAEGEADEMAGKVEAAIGKTIGRVYDGLTHAGDALKK
jgi:uncharacterized protein YjbJ (UPF0337 family)